MGAYLDLYNQERPHQALGYQTPGEVFEQDLQGRWLQDQSVVLLSGIETFPLVAADSLNPFMALTELPSRMIWFHPSLPWLSKVLKNLSKICFHTPRSRHLWRQRWQVDRVPIVPFRPEWYCHDRL